MRLRSNLQKIYLGRRRLLVALGILFVVALTLFRYFSTQLPVKYQDDRLSVRVEGPQVSIAADDVTKFLTSEQVVVASEFREVASLRSSGGIVDYYSCRVAAVYRGNDALDSTIFVAQREDAFVNRDGSIGFIVRHSSVPRFDAKRYAVLYLKYAGYAVGVSYPVANTWGVRPVDSLVEANNIMRTAAEQAGESTIPNSTFAKFIRASIAPSSVDSDKIRANFVRRLFDARAVHGEVNFWDYGQALRECPSIVYKEFAEAQVPSQRASFRDWPRKCYMRPVLPLPL
jgi:hypothetical protein